MITDISISLSRKKEDKVAGTGRFHIMKNRYGGDGMTYPVKINTENGNIEIESREMSEDEFVQEGSQTPGKPITSFSAEERNFLQQRFFELGK